MCSGSIGLDGAPNVSYRQLYTNIRYKETSHMGSLSSLDHQVCENFGCIVSLRCVEASSICKPQVYKGFRYVAASGVWVLQECGRFRCVLC